MSDICCLLGICCPPGSDEQLAEFEVALHDIDGIDKPKAKKIAKALAKDLADFTEKIAKFAAEQEPAD